jgi:hypothetical protein
MKISFLAFAALALLLAGCAGPAPREGSGAAMQGLAQQQKAAAPWAENDYRWVLSDPGPF